MGDDARVSTPPLSAVTVSDAAHPSGIDLGASPRDAIEIGAALADAARGLGATVVIHWSGEGDAVLAHVVAAELGLERVSLAIDEGLMSASRELPDGSSLLLVAKRFDRKRPIAPLVSYAEARGHRCVGAASIVASVDDVDAGSMPAIHLS